MGVFVLTKKSHLYHGNIFVLLLLQYSTQSFTSKALWYSMFAIMFAVPTGRTIYCMQHGPAVQAITQSLQGILKVEVSITVPLTSCLTGCVTTDNFCFYMKNRLLQISQTGGQWYSVTSPISIPWSILLRCLNSVCREICQFFSFAYFFGWVTCRCCQLAPR